MQALRARVYGRRIELYDPPGVPLLAEAGRLRTRYRAGSSAVEVPRVGDSHGDVVLALAAAVFEHDRHGGARVRVSQADPRRLPEVGSLARDGASDYVRAGLQGIFGAGYHDAFS